MKRNWIVIVVVAVIVLVVGVTAMRRSGTHDTSVANAPEPPPSVTAAVETVSEQSVPQWLEATGVVRAELDAQVAAKVMGRVGAVYVREGDSVRRGQLLVRLDARDLEASVAQAAAGVRSAGAGYDSARVAAQMEEASSSARIGAARAQVAQSDAAVRAARAKLDMVSAGPRRQERTQASLAVNQAKANLALAETNLGRYEALAKEGAISRQQYDQAKNQYDVSKAQLDTAIQGQSMTDEGSRSEDIRSARDGLTQAQAALDQAKAGLQQAQALAFQINVRRQDIRGAQALIGQSKAALQLASVTRSFAIVAAPFDGVVTARLADPGAMASPGTPLMRIQGGQIRLEAVVPESALMSVRKGARVPVVFDALNDARIDGTVVEIAPQGDPSSHTFVVKIALPAGSGARAGMFGRGKFATGTERKMLVPPSAVLEREGLSYVYVVDGSGTARLRIVTLGDRRSGGVQVLSGLNPRERIVASGIERLSDGAKVAAQ